MGDAARAGSRAWGRSRRRRWRGTRRAPGQPGLQRAGLVAGAVGAVEVMDVHPLRPVLRHGAGDDLAGLVRRVVEHLDLQPAGRIIEPADGVDQPLGHVHLVVEWQLYRDHGPGLRIGRQLGGWHPRPPGAQVDHDQHQPVEAEERQHHQDGVIECQQGRRPREAHRQCPVRRPGPVAFALLPILAPILAVNLGLLLVFDLAHHLALTLALLGAAFLGLLFATPRLETASVPTGAILLGALLLRLPLLPLPPTLSDDVLRYLWDGKVAAAGLNPYALAPAAEKLTPLRDEIWRRMPHKAGPHRLPAALHRGLQYSDSAAVSDARLEADGHRGRSRRLLAAPAARPRRRSAGRGGRSGTPGIRWWRWRWRAWGTSTPSGWRRWWAPRSSCCRELRRPGTAATARGGRHPRQAGPLRGAADVGAAERPAGLVPHRRPGPHGRGGAAGGAGHGRGAAGAGDLRRLLGVQRSRCSSRSGGCSTRPAPPRPSPAASTISRA